MRGFTSLQNSAPEKNSQFWVVRELTLSITQIHTDAFAKCVSRISDGAPGSPGALSDRLPRLLVKTMHACRPEHAGTALEEFTGNGLMVCWVFNWAFSSDGPHETDVLTRRRDPKALVFCSETWFETPMSRDYSDSKHRGRVKSFETCLTCVWLTESETNHTIAHLAQPNSHKV